MRTACNDISKTICSYIAVEFRPVGETARRAELQRRTVWNGDHSRTYSSTECISRIGVSPLVCSWRCRSGRHSVIAIAAVVQRISVEWIIRNQAIRKVDLGSY